MIVAEVLKNIQTKNAASFPWKGREFKRELSIYSSPKNYNSELGLVFSVFCIEEYTPGIKNLLKIAVWVFFQAFFAQKKYDVLIAEYGIDAPADMDFLLKIATPDIVVVTKLGSVHSENFPGGISELWQQKWLLPFSAKKKVYFNAWDAFSQEQKSSLLQAYEEIFQTEIPSSLSLLGETLIQSWEYRNIKLSLNLLGREEQEYVNLWLMLAADLWISLTLSNYDFRLELLPGRFGIFESGENIFIDSTYNASPEAVIKLIENTKTIHQKMYPDYKLGLVLWDMREIGEVNETAHKELVPLVQEASLVLTVGPQMQEHFIPELKVFEYPWDVHASLSSREVWKYLKNYLKNNSENKYLILFKWSQNTIFVEEALAENIAPEQQKKLIRQSDAWKEKKDIFFHNEEAS